MKNAVIWDVLSCSLVDICGCFRETFLFFHQSG